MNELKHYGVLGMRWGRRKGTSNISKVASDRKKEKMEKKDFKEVDRAATKRNRGLYIRANNKAINEINNREIESFNKKWDKKMKGYTDYEESPLYNEYVKDYCKMITIGMDRAVRNDPQSKFTTKSGKEYTARFLKESGNIVWGSNDEWAQYDKQK